MSLNIFISAGDQSGDRHAAKLMKEIRLKEPNVKFYGIGGVFMIEQGLNSIIDLKEISVVGFWEVAKKYLTFRKLFENAKNLINNNKIDLFIAVDYPGFNVPLAKYAKDIGVKSIYYIAPQLWAWGENRAKKLVNAIDLALVVFPFEEDYFAKFGINAKFNGHPILDDPDFQTNIGTYSQRRNEITFLPGSRTQEITKNMPLFIETAKCIANINSNICFSFACAPSIDKSSIAGYLSDLKNSYIIDNSREAMKFSRAALVKTGTSCLESALLGAPFAMAYKTSSFTYFLGKKLINLEYISLPNILAKRKIVNEFIQSEAKPELIANDLVNYAQNEAVFDAKQAELLEIRNFLGNSGASERAAQAILEELAC